MQKKEATLGNNEVKGSLRGSGSPRDKDRIRSVVDPDLQKTPIFLREDLYTTVHFPSEMQYTVRYASFLGVLLFT